MRIIVHCADPEDMVYAMRCVQTSIREGYKQRAYYGEPEKASVFCYQNKTGWTIRVERALFGGEGNGD